MNRDDRLFRNIVIALAIVEAFAIAAFVLTRLHIIGR